MLGWIWRFRPEYWHRNNALLLIGLIVVGTAIALKPTAGRAGLPFILPTAAAGMLLAILLDAGVATLVMVVIALLGGAVNLTEQLASSIAAYILVGGLAGIVAIRRGDRLQVFVQAGLAVAVANVLVVSTFALLGLHDARGLLELVGASVASAAGAAVAAVGSFAVLGSLFGILTVFQLLELANPSQPLLRRLLVETPGTYHHSLMVGNLAERAAEAIGADPLLTRVAAYYHDIGKLANPLAFIENQAGGENIHDELDPEVSAQILKQHVADGIDIAYKAKLPEGAHRVHPAAPRDGDHELLLRPGPRASAAEPFGGPQTPEGAKAAGGRRRAQVPPRRPEAAVAGGGADHARRRRRGVGPVARVARRAGDPGDGRADHRRAAGGRPVRRVRPDAARHRADQGGVRRPAARDVPPAHRLSRRTRSSSSSRAAGRGPAPGA